MSHNEDLSTSPPLFGEHAPSSSSSSEVSNDKVQSQREYKKTNTNQLPAASSKEEARKKMLNLNKKIHLMEVIRIIFVLAIFSFSFTSILFLYLPVKVFGMSFSSFLLLSHSLSFLSLFIVHYHLLPLLLDESSLIEHKLEDGTYYLPSYHRSKYQLLCCYQRILYVILIDAGIWIYLSYTDFPYAKDESDKETVVCVLSGVLMILVTIYVLMYIGPVSSEANIKKHKPKPGKQDINKEVNLKGCGLLSELKAETLKETRKLRNEMLAKDASYSNLKKENYTMFMELQEKERENYKTLMALQERDKEKDKVILELSQDVKRLRRQRTTKN